MTDPDEKTILHGEGAGFSYFVRRKAHGYRLNFIRYTNGDEVNAECHDTGDSLITRIETLMDNLISYKVLREFVNIMEKYEVGGNFADSHDYNAPFYSAVGFPIVYGAEAKIPLTTPWCQYDYLGFFFQGKDGLLEHPRTSKRITGDDLLMGATGQFILPLPKTENEVLFRADTADKNNLFFQMRDKGGGHPPVRLVAVIARKRHENTLKGITERLRRESDAREDVR